MHPMEIHYLVVQYHLAKAQSEVRDQAEIGGMLVGNYRIYVTERVPLDAPNRKNAGKWCLTYLDSAMWARDPEYVGAPACIWCLDESYPRIFDTPEMALFWAGMIEEEYDYGHN
jgi:hypothetical protein